MLMSDQELYASDVLRDTTPKGPRLTVGGLRKLLRDNRGLPDDTLVVLDVPMIDDEGTVYIQQTQVGFAAVLGVQEDGNGSVDGYIPVRERRGEEWEFSLCIFPNVWDYFEDIYGENYDDYQE
jgi:hypothetical protein